MSSIGTFSDSDDERYEANLAKKRAEAEALLREQEQKERLERQARKEAKLAERKRLEEELRRKQEEEEIRQREEQRQKDLAHRLEADRVAAVEQQRRKNWMKAFQPPSFPPSDEEMNLLDYPPLTKRQRVRYLPKETPEARERREELAREMGTSVVGGGCPCERCADFGILCIPQTLPNATSCAPCAKAKAACKPFDADNARTKAKAETARRSKARRAKQQTDAEWKSELLRKLDGLGELQGLRKDVRRIAVALEKLAGIEGRNSDEELLSWPESEGEVTEIQGGKEKGKKREEKLDGEDKEKEMETEEQEEDNGMEGVEEGSSRFSPAAYSVGTGIL